MDSSSSWTPTITDNALQTSLLMQRISSIASVISTETDSDEQFLLSLRLQRAQASYTLLSAEEFLATATDQSLMAQATEAISQATEILNPDYSSTDSSGAHSSVPGNVFYLVIFTIVFLYTVGMLYRSRYHWYNVTFFFGQLLQVVGWFGRVLYFKYETLLSISLMQYVGLTVSPAFLMAGIYFLFAQLVVIHGRDYSILKPMWYSYFFITSDIFSLIVQAMGGIAFAISVQGRHNDKIGQSLIITGIVIQVSAMAVFAVFWFEFLNRLYFKHLKEIMTQKSTPYARRSIGNFCRMLFNFELIREYRSLTLEDNYNPHFREIRSRKLFPWLPLAITVSVILIYIRSVYRIVEIAQGPSGHLFSHEEYLMVLEALPVALACLVFIPFHPVWVFGQENKLKWSYIKRKQDEEVLEVSLLSVDLTAAPIIAKL